MKNLIKFCFVKKWVLRGGNEKLGQNAENPNLKSTN